jgi:hypothetical protein
MMKAGFRPEATVTMPVSSVGYVIRAKKIHEP